MEINGRKTIINRGRKEAIIEMLIAESKPQSVVSDFDTYALKDAGILELGWLFRNAIKDEHPYMAKKSYEKLCQELSDIKRPDSHVSASVRASREELEVPIEDRFDNVLKFPKKFNGPNKIKNQTPRIERPAVTTRDPMVVELSQNNATLKKHSGQQAAYISHLETVLRNTIKSKNNNSLVATLYSATMSIITIYFVYSLYFK